MIDSIKINTDRYIYFTDDGSITKILNYVEDDGTHIVVDYEAVEDILSGKDTALGYIVIYDHDTSSYVLKKRMSSNSFLINATDYIQEFSKHTDKTPDLTVVQDIPQKQWIVKLGNSLKSQLVAQRMVIHAPIQISITASGDPHILYKVITVKIDDIVNSISDYCIKFTNEDEANTDISLFTVKKLQTYKYEVINE